MFRCEHANNIALYVEKASLIEYNMLAEERKMRVNLLFAIKRHWKSRSIKTARLYRTAVYKALLFGFLMIMSF
jgi:hypothetical protein